MAGRAWGSSSRLYSPPIMAGQATKLIARDSRLLDMASRASRSNSKGEKPSTFFLQKARTELSPACSVKVRHLEQARSNRCHLGSACSSHLVDPTHLVEKRGAHEKARLTLCHVGSGKVFSMFLLPLELCSLPAQSKPVTSNKRDPICALPAQSKWTV